MHIRTIALSIFFFTLGTISIGIVYAWSEPTATPPNDNVAAPINVGSTDQVKDGGIGVNKLAVFGNSLLGGFTGSNAYLNLVTASATMPAFSNSRMMAVRGQVFRRACKI